MWWGTWPEEVVVSATSSLSPPDMVQASEGAGSPPAALHLTTTVELILVTSTPPVTSLPAESSSLTELTGLTSPRNIL